MPIVSVIMSVYKEPIKWLQESIDSILNQTFHDFEFIIICDNPSYSEGIAMLYSYAEKDHRIVLIENEKNLGLTKSLNKGITVAKGDFIARMDADDISLPERFEKQISYLENHPEIGVCGSIIDYMGDRKGVKYYPEKYEDMYLFLESPFAHPTVMIRKNVLSMTRGYDEEFEVSQDYALWTELYAKGVKFYNFQSPLLHYRVSEQQIMAKKNSMQQKLSCIIRRRALDCYNEKHNIDYKIGDKVITSNEIDNIKKLLVLPPHIRGSLLFYLYISWNSNVLIKLYKIFQKGDISQIGIFNTLRILKFQLLNMSAEKF